MNPVRIAAVTTATVAYAAVLVAAIILGAILWLGGTIFDAVEDIRPKTL